MLTPPRAVLPPDQYRLLIEHSPVMTWRAGVDAKCNYFNETWLAFTGRTQEQEANDGWTEGVHPEDLDRCVRCYLDHFERRQSFEMEYRLRRHDSVYRYIFDRGVPYSDDSGQFAGFIGSCVDVHERRTAEDEKAGFLSLLAHELRTPLTALRMFSAGVQRKVQRGQEVPLGILEKMIRQIEHLSDLVKDLAETGLRDAGPQLSIVPVPLDLGPLIDEAMKKYRDAYEQRPEADRKHSFVFEMRGTAFPTRGDSRRLEQVFTNILDNAVKYSPRGSQVRVELKTEGARHFLLCADEGIGVPAEEIPHLTRRYFRASNASHDNYPGLGIGLTIVQNVIERLGGALDIQSKLGFGTTITVSLPSIEGTP